jgi:hypothetical protein
MASLLEIFRPSRLETLVRVQRIKLTENIICREHGSSFPSSCRAGDVLDVDHTLAAELAAAGSATILGEVINGEIAKPRASKPAPALAVPQPIPSELKKLPAEFSDAWRLVAERGALNTDLRAALRALLPPAFVKAQEQAEAHGTPIEKFFLSQIVSGEALVDRAKRDEHAAKMQRRIEEFDTKNGRRIYAILERVGVLTVEKIDAANTALEDLQAVALQIFSARIAALGLHRNKVIDLYRGSAVALKFGGELSPLGASDAVSTGGPAPRRMLDAPLLTIATIYRQAEERAVELEALIAEAQAELASVQGVSALAKTKPRLGT